MKQITQSFQATVTCPNCHKTHHETFITLVESVKDPRHVNAIFKGTLQQKTCPHCGYVTTYQYPILYHNALHKTLIAFAYENTEEMEEYEKMFRRKVEDKILTPWLDTHSVRLTSKYHDFQEKVLLDQLDLDDTLMEIAKAKLNLPLDTVFMNFDKGFFTLSTKSLTPFTKEDYENLKKEFVALSDEIRVDRDYALQQLTNKH